MTTINPTAFFTDIDDIMCANMQTLSDDAQDNVVIIGNFDGIHQGHQALIKQARDIATKHNAYVVMLSFLPHPRQFFNPDKPYHHITSLLLKYNIAHQYGVDFLIKQPFDATIASLSPQEFINDILITICRAKHIIVGEDFCFGAKRQGTIKNLQAHAHLTIYPITLKRNDDGILSSSVIKHYITQGNIEGVNAMLGRTFMIDGVVKRDKQLGRTLNFPTANISMHDYIRPLYGVYAVTIYIDNVAYPAISNIGMRPTINDSKQDICEVHIFNFDADIYNKHVIVEFHQFIRNEQKFSSLDELKKQIEIDCDKVKDYFYLSK